MIGCWTLHLSMRRETDSKDSSIAAAFCARLLISFPSSSVNLVNCLALSSPAGYCRCPVLATAVTMTLNFMVRIKTNGGKMWKNCGGTPGGKYSYNRASKTTQAGCLGHRSSAPIEAQLKFNELLRIHWNERRFPLSCCWSTASAC